MLRAVCPVAVRRLAFVLALLVAPAAAQDAVPDTVAPERYYPIEVGNRWEYEVEPGNLLPDGTHYRHTIVADTLVDGERWFVQREQGFRRLVEGNTEVWDRLFDERLLLRFDSNLANVVIRADGHASPYLPCRLDLSVLPDGGKGECGAGVYLKEVLEVSVGGDRLRSPVVWFSGPVYGPFLAADLGLIRSASEVSPASVLVHAHVEGRVYGDPIDGMPYVPDLTPPASYYPLGVGDQWVYSEQSVIRHAYRRRTVVGDSTVGGHTYAVVEHATYDLDAEAPT